MDKLNKNVEHASDRLYYAVVAPYGGVGEPKLILHEATIENSGSISYGLGGTLVVDPASVLRLSPYTEKLSFKPGEAE